MGKSAQWICHECKTRSLEVNFFKLCPTCGHPRCIACDVYFEATSTMPEGLSYLRETTKSSQPGQGNPSTKEKDRGSSEASADDKDDNTMNYEIPDSRNYEDPRAIIDPVNYFEDLDDLVTKAIQMLNISRFPIVGEKVIVDSTSTSIGDCVHEINSLYNAFKLLQSHGFCGAWYTLFLQDPTRPRVALATRIREEYLKMFLDAIDYIFWITSDLDWAQTHNSCIRQELMVNIHFAIDSSEELLPLCKSPFHLTYLIDALCEGRAVGIGI